MIISGETLLFGVLGDPIKQIKTPAHLNPVFQRRAANISCVPFHCSSSKLADFWLGAKAMQNVAGFGVTLPHKSQAFRLCDSVGTNAQRTGVVNVVKRLPDGSLHGDIFDGISFVRGLARQGHDLKGLSVFIFGAGGAATAICFALIEAGVAKISIQNRTRANAEKLVAHLKTNSPLENIHVADVFDPTTNLAINSSSLGMEAHDPIPIDTRQLAPGTIVAEVVANPEMTTLLSEAKERGCKVHSGIHMIHNQMELIADFILSDGSTTR